MLEDFVLLSFAPRGIFFFPFQVRPKIAIQKLIKKVWVIWCYKLFSGFIRWRGKKKTSCLWVMLPKLWDHEGRVWWEHSKTAPAWWKYFIRRSEKQNTRPDIIQKWLESGGEKVWLRGSIDLSRSREFGKANHNWWQCSISVSKSWSHAPLSWLLEYLIDENQLDLRFLLYTLLLLKETPGGAWKGMEPLSKNCQIN